MLLMRNAHLYSFIYIYFLFVLFLIKLCKNVWLQFVKQTCFDQNSVWLKLFSSYWATRTSICDLCTFQIMLIESDKMTKGSSFANHFYPCLDLEVFLFCVCVFCLSLCPCVLLSMDWFLFENLHCCNILRAR